MPRFRRSKGALFLFLAFLEQWVAGGQGAPGAKQVIEIVLSSGEANPPRVEYSPRPLEQAAGPIHRNGETAAVPAYVRVLGGPAQNSRTPGSPRPGQWSVQWQSPVPSAASAVMIGGDRVLVQRSGGWTLLKRSGAKITEGISGGGVMTLDPSAGAFYALGAGNLLQALALENGELRFSVALGFSEAFAWPLFCRDGKRLIAAGVEIPTFSHDPQPATESFFHVTEIASPLELSPYKELLSMTVHQNLVFKEPKMIPVAAGDILWAVLPDLLIRTSSSQNIDGAWSAAFRAVSASADESGWLHLVVATGEAATGRELWVVTPDGHRTVRAKVPPSYGESKYPPAIGYDHRIYLVGPQTVAAFSPDGALLWESQPLGSIAGVSVTPDHRVVVAAGNEILVLDATGKAAQLAKLPAPARTCPVVTAEGEILVGTESNVLCLHPH